MPPPPQTRIGLYYPFIHFRSDTWVKAAALYWDKIARIVPDGYETQDSETVRRLEQELGFIQNFAPNATDTQAVKFEFDYLLHEYPTEIASLYSLPEQGPGSISLPDIRIKADAAGTEFIWPSSVRTLATTFAADAQNVPQVLSAKMSWQLRHVLIHRGLARYASDDSVEMHPYLGFVYMEALASAMASSRFLYPLTDNAFSHVAIGCSMEQIAAALLSPARATQHPKGVERDVDVQFATIALESVLPKEIATIPVEKIIQLRKRHADELAAFRRYAEEVTAQLPLLSAVSDVHALRAHLDAMYQDTLRPQLLALKRQLRALGLDTAVSALSVKLESPGLLAGLAAMAGGIAHINPVAVGAGALVIAATSLGRTYRRTRHIAMSGSPAAYLLRIERDLHPRTLSETIQRHAAAFATKIR